jgi:hypothetical protein
MGNNVTPSIARAAPLRNERREQSSRRWARRFMVRSCFGKMVQQKAQQKIRKKLSEQKEIHAS